MLCNPVDEGAEQGAHAQCPRPYTTETLPSSFAKLRRTSCPSLELARKLKGGDEYLEKAASYKYFAPTGLRKAA